MSNANRRPMTAAEYRLAQAKAMPEKELLAAVRRLAEGLSWRTYHTHRSEHSPAGFPDLTLVRRGRLVLAELKRQANRYQPTPEQAAWLEDLDEVARNVYGYSSAAGVEDLVTVHLWRPLDLLDGTITAALK